jgi:uncharacterized membrane protein
VATKKVKNQNLELAGSLISWSQKNLVEDDIYVKSLAQSLETGIGLQSLAQYDATQTLPHPENGAGLKESRYSETLISVRNILVFVPVAFTWAGISQATAAYSEYTAANPNTIVNFFDFWENGYGVLSKFWTLSSITRIGFLLLSIIIVASTVIAVLQKKSSTQKQEAEKMIAKERFRLGFEINQYLFQFKTITPTALNQNSLAAVRELKATSVATAKIVKSAEKSAAEIARGSVIRKQLDSIKNLIERIGK